VTYSGRNQDMTLAGIGSQIPVPDLNLAMDSSSWRFDMPIVVSDGPAFLVNRLLLPYLTEALELLLDGATIDRIERAAVCALAVFFGTTRLIDNRLLGTRKPPPTG
jgi:hypothetical protein